MMNALSSTNDVLENKEVKFSGIKKKAFTYCKCWVLIHLRCFSKGPLLVAATVPLFLSKRPLI